MNCITQHVVSHWSFDSQYRYEDPFNEIELDVLFTGADGQGMLVPAYWAGQQVWQVRFSPPTAGRYNWKTICSDTSNRDLHNVTGQFDVTPYDGANHLYKHGSLRIGPGRRHFQYEDGTPFFWLADTWWMGLCQRLRWPEDFQKLARDRLEKGFSVIQIVAGLYPDMEPFDERGANEAGFAWEKDFTQINPKYFDYVDRRIAYLIELGLVPCLVGCWGYFIQFMGIERIMQHWRYLIARYGAYPVFWCAAGEAMLPFYRSGVREEGKLEEYIAQVRPQWTQVVRYIRKVDPYRRLLTIHPSTVRSNDLGRDMVDDDALLDFDMIQSGHGGSGMLPHAINLLSSSRQRRPAMPYLIAEACYEGLGEMNRQEIQRLYFWCSILCGAAGYSYGANGVWQVNTRQMPYGPSPTGSSWGNTPWEDAYQLPGSSDLGIAKKLLERYSWWKFEPHQNWVAPEGQDGYLVPYAAGIVETVRVIYFHPSLLGNVSQVYDIEPGVNYRAFYFNPNDASEFDLGNVVPDERGVWKVPRPPIARDWAIVMETGTTQ